MEYSEFVRRAEDNKASYLAGRVTNNWGILGYSEQGERRLENMPTYGNFRTQLQDPATGLPWYMDGVDELGSDDNAGLAPSNVTSTYTGGE